MLVVVVTVVEVVVVMSLGPFSFMSMERTKKDIPVMTMMHINIAASLALISSPT